MILNSFDIPKTTFIFLRHGEPIGGKIFRGSTDDPLTDAGWKQMQKAVLNLVYDEIVSSPLKRCLEFSKQIQQETSLPLSVVDEIQELHLGDWEGLSVEQVEKIDAKALREFWAAPQCCTPPNAERFIDFEQRILSAFETLKGRYISNEESKTVLVVCHAGVMMVLLKSWLQLPIENILCLKLNYASKIRVELHDASYNLKPQIYIDHGYEF